MFGDCLLVFTPRVLSFFFFPLEMYGSYSKGKCIPLVLLDLLMCYTMFCFACFSWKHFSPLIYGKFVFECTSVVIF